VIRNRTTEDTGLKNNGPYIRMAKRRSESEGKEVSKEWKKQE